MLICAFCVINGLVWHWCLIRGFWRGSNWKLEKCRKSLKIHKLFKLVLYSSSVRGKVTKNDWLENFWTIKFQHLLKLWNRKGGGQTFVTFFNCRILKSRSFLIIFQVDPPKRPTNLSIQANHKNQTLQARKIIKTAPLLFAHIFESFAAFNSKFSIINCMHDFFL